MGGRMIICFFGKRGSGKTTAIKGQLKFCKPPIVILDVLGNFDQASLEKLGVHANQATSISDCLLKIAEYVKTKDDKFKTIVLQTSSPNDAANYISSALWEAHGGTMILDEIDSISMAEAECFDQLIRYGRNRGVDVITGCRRPAEMSRNITAAANQVYCFRTNEPRDLDYFQATAFGERAEQLMDLPNYSGLWINHDDQTGGTFRIDESGNVFKTNSESLSEQSQIDDVDKEF